MRYVSLFSGIEAASVAWEPLGWEPMAFSEIDPFPCSVLADRYPDVPNLGDITWIDWRKFASKHGKPDLVVGGSPCQSFSVAGSRTGLEGASGLMWEYVRAVRDLMPEWIVWENVPGALSSSSGEDFRCLLRALDEIGFGLAWRVLDAQFFGLAQRRERLFLVGRLGDVEGPCEVLFEPESLLWDTPSSREKRKELAGGTGKSPGLCYQIAGNIINRKPENGGHQLGVRDQDCDGAFTLTATDVHSVAVLPFDTTQVTSPQNGSHPKWGDPCHPLCANGHVPTICMGDAGANASMDEDLCGTLKANNDRNPPIVSQYGDISGTLTARQDSSQCVDRGQTVVAVDCRNHTVNGEVSGTLQAKSNGGQSLNYINPVMCGSVVRRLTPRECERLQGFPDDWTLVPYKGKAREDCPDSPRYKALGNSMAVPVMRWIGKRLESVDER